jgi:predicted amidohydrolase YtcJ
MRASTLLAVLSALCAALAMVPHPEQVALQFARDPRSSLRAAAQLLLRRRSSSRPDHPPASGATTTTTSCPLGFGSGSGGNGGTAPASLPFAASREHRQWFIGAGGGWTGSDDSEEEGPVWLEPGGGFAVDGAGEIAEVAATRREADEALERDRRSGLLADATLRPTIHLRGAYVIPGIVDPHVHLIPAGLALTSHADLRAAASRADFEAGVATAALRLLLSSAEAAAACNGSSSSPILPWLMGGWWDESRWPGREMPTQEWIDAGLERAAAAAEEQQQDKQQQGGATPTPACLRALPVLLSRMDGHMAVANREALRLARAAAAKGDGQGSGGGSVLAEGMRELLSLVGEDGRAAAAAATPSAGRFVDPSAGLVREAGLLATARASPTPALAARRAALAAACRHALARGVTAVGDMGRAPFAGGDASASWDDLEQLYSPAADADAAADEAAEALPSTPQLPIRVAAYLPLETWPRLAARVEARGSVASGRRGAMLLLASGVKEFWDGSLGSRTALMTEPYEDQEGGGNNNNNNNRGVRMVDSPEEAALAMAGADAAGLQLAVHAIGDLAVDEVAAAMARVAEARRERQQGASALLPSPMRLEHVQHLSSAADSDPARRLAALARPEDGGNDPALLPDALVAVINPQHLVSDAALMAALPRSMRAAGNNRTHAWRRLADAGVPLAVGSDWPIVALDPWAALWAAVYREGVQEEEGRPRSPNQHHQHPDGLTPLEALRASTSGAAFAAGLDAWTGRLVPGLKADFVLLDRSVFSEEGGEKRALSSVRPRVLSTYVGGQCRHGCSRGGGGGGGGGSVEAPS